MNRRDLDDPRERAAALGDLEALLFAAARPLSLAEIARRLYLEEPQAAELVDLLDQELGRPERGLRLRDAGAKWQLETRADREDVVAGLRAERGALHLLQPFPAAEMHARPVSRDVGNVKNNHPELLNSR